MFSMNVVQLHAKLLKNSIAHLLAMPNGRQVQMSLPDTQYVGEAHFMA